MPQQASPSNDFQSRLFHSPSEAVSLQTWNNFAAIISNSAAGFISDRVGRKRNLLGAWVLCAAVIVICSIFVAPNQFLFCIGLMLLFGFSLNYAITSVNLLMPEQYPTAIRALHGSKRSLALEALRPQSCSVASRA